MKTHFSKLTEIFQNELKTIYLDECHFPIDELNQTAQFIENLLEEMKVYFLTLKQVTANNEIVFFKEIKSEILGFLLYFNRVHTIEHKCTSMYKL